MGLISRVSSRTYRGRGSINNLTGKPPGISNSNSNASTSPSKHGKGNSKQPTSKTQVSNNVNSSLQSRSTSAQSHQSNNSNFNTYGRSSSPSGIRSGNTITIVPKSASRSSSVNTADPQNPNNVPQHFRESSRISTNSHTTSFVQSDEEPLISKTPEVQRKKSKDGVIGKKESKKHHAVEKSTGPST